eukprot:9046972-Alexandrium_andersonii.AAC.1
MATCQGFKADPQTGQWQGMPRACQGPCHEPTHAPSCSGAVAKAPSGGGIASVMCGQLPNE